MLARKDKIEKLTKAIVAGSEENSGASADNPVIFLSLYIETSLYL